MAYRRPQPAFNGNWYDSYDFTARPKPSFSTPPRKYVRNKNFAFMHHCFHMKIRPSGLGIRYTAIMQDSLHYLDLAFIHNTLCRLSNKQKYLKETKANLLDELGLDWDPRNTERYKERVLNRYKRDWVYFQSYRFWTLVLLIKKVIDDGGNVTDILARIRKCIKPLGLAMRLVRVVTPDDKYQDQNILRFLIDKLATCPESPALLVEALRLFSNSEVRRFFLYAGGNRTLDYMLRNSQKAGYCMWGILPSLHAEPSPVSEYYIYNTVEAISIVVKYGGNIEKAAFMHRKGQTGVGVSNQISNVTYLAPFRINWVKRSRREMLMNQIIYFARMTSERMMDPDEAMTCLRLIWRSLPDTYPTRSELSDHMATTCEWMEKLSKTYSATVEMVCDFFEEAVSYNALDLPQPRYLKHHCRCTIRRIIGMCGGMVEGITGLKLRKLLLNYVNLES